MAGKVTKPELGDKPIDVTDYFRVSSKGCKWIVPPRKELVEKLANRNNFFFESLNRAWLLKALGAKPAENADNVIMVGCCRLYEQPFVVAAYFRLLNELGIKYNLIDEYCCTGPLEIMTKPEDMDETLALMKSLNKKNIDNAKAVGASKMFYYCTGCMGTVQKLFEKTENGVTLGYSPDIFIEPLKKVKQLKAKPARVGYFRGCGRRYLKKVSGLPNKFERLENEYRSMVDRIEGIEIVDIPHNICCKDNVKAVAKSIAAANVDYTVTPCFGCRLYIEDEGVKIIQLHELLLEAVTYQG
jgi:Fe-S oxidoreductase